MQIMNEVTNLKPRMMASNVMTLDDPELTKYPIAYMAEPGYWTVTDQEAEAFRKYLQKGGFAIFDDFHYQDWPYFEQAMKKVLPDAQFVDLTVDHPIFHTFFEVESFDVVKQYYDQGRPIFRAVFEDNDPSKRLIAIANYNTNLAEYWQIGSEGFFPVESANNAFKLGVNYMVYGLTH